MNYNLNKLDRDDVNVRLDRKEVILFTLHGAKLFF